jgi:hypothetical protein
LLTAADSKTKKIENQKAEKSGRTPTLELDEADGAT